MASPSNSTNLIFPYNLASIKPSNKLTGSGVALWHMPCSPFSRVDLGPCVAQEVDLGYWSNTMNDMSTQQNGLPRTRVTKPAHKQLCLTAIVTGILLSIVPFVVGCAPGENANQSTVPGGPPSGASASASLTWDPVTDPSVTAYFVHYGQQSPGQSGSCTYENSISVDSPAATVTNLDPNTLYYFTVSAYNGLESACSNEVSLVTAPAPIGNETTPATFS